MSSQFRRYLNLLLCFLLFTSKVCASGLQDALEEHLKDVAHNEQSESFKLEKDKGEKDHHIDTQKKDSHSNQYSKEKDESKFVNKDHESKISSDKDAYEGYNNKQDKTENNQSNGFKRGHKKGHHNQGFQNSYHKDESSNKSTFFDDFNDEGDQRGYNSKLNNYENQGGRRYDGSRSNGQEYLRNNYRGRGQNRYGDVGDKRATHQDYGRNYYIDNSENHNKYRNHNGAYDRGKSHDRYEHHAPPVHYEPRWDSRDWNNRRGWDRQGWDRHPEWDRDYQRQSYYDDHSLGHEGGYENPSHSYGYRYGESRSEPVTEAPKEAPIIARRKQTITIYEDPRYSGKENTQMRREEGDYIELDFQPSSRRYASYDTTYYNLPATEEGAKQSNINKLVYNYRRQ